MEIDIKCSECGKGTRHFDLGEIFYLPDNASETIIVKDAITCPKCGKDISNKKCMVRANELLMRFVAANLYMSVGDVPKHLKGAYPLGRRDYDLAKGKCLSQLKLVEL